MSKIPFTFWYDRTPCGSPLRALARVRISAYIPIHRMQNYKGLLHFATKITFSLQTATEMQGIMINQLATYMTIMIYVLYHHISIFGQRGELHNLDFLVKSSELPLCNKIIRIELPVTLLKLKTSNNSQRSTLGWLFGQAHWNKGIRCKRATSATAQALVGFQHHTQHLINVCDICAYIS